MDLSRLCPGGEGGGIKPALREMLGWLGQQSAPPLTFVYLIDPALGKEMQDWLRPVDRQISKLEAPADVAARENCDVVYCPFGLTEWACPGIPVVTLIVDLLHQDFPESLQPVDIAHREQGFRWALERTDLFQVISNYTAMQIRRHGAVESNRIFRTYLPVQDRLPGPISSSPSRPFPYPYFFYPANAWVHKNHEILLLAYASYRHMAGNAAWKLVLTGHLGEAMQHLRQVAATLGLAKDVKFTGYVTDADLAKLWDGAGALVFPSLHEGFGIPLLEAMARNVPILSSDATAIPEITGPAALLVDGRSLLALAEGLRRMASEPALRLSLAAAGRARLAAFDAAAEFGGLLATFQAIAGQPARWRHSGYHGVDGLIESLAIFALPTNSANGDLEFATSPLGVARTLEFWCGATCLMSLSVFASAPTVGRMRLPAEARVLTLRVPDASRLNTTDARTHGVVLTRLCVIAEDGKTTDLRGLPT
ncbi:MAG: glycosyltransferase family 1 protein [Lacunisphaera sp.]